jgi:hypothetical protein
MRACLFAALVLTVTPAAADKARRMTAEAVKLKGLTLKKTLDADLDGDGKRELIGVASASTGIQLVLVGEDADGAVVIGMAPPLPGKELAKAEVMGLLKGSQQIVLEVNDETPDEKVKRVRVYGASFKELFNSKVERPRATDARPEWETDKSIVQYGDPRAGWYFDDLQDDGVSEIIVRRNVGAQIIRIPRNDGDPVKLLTGIRERVWSWDADKSRYVEGPERLNDFLPAYGIASVKASGVWVEPKELKALQSKALSDALMQATAAAAAPGGAPSGTGGAVPLTDDVKADLSSYVKLGADGSLKTAWIENDARGDGKGEWLEVALAEEQPIHMVRLVLGCVDTDATFRAHNVPESFTLQLDVGGQHEVNLRKGGEFAGAVVAFTDEHVKMQDRSWAKTTLVFFDGKTKATTVRVALDKAIKQGKGNLTCISEMSVH